MIDPVENRRIAFEMNRRGFRLFTSARIFVQGLQNYYAYDYKAALKSFQRLVELEPSNPYACAYCLFAMEDDGTFTVQELADMSARWSEAAIKYRYQGQDALSMAYFTKYMKRIETMDISEKI